MTTASRQLSRVVRGTDLPAYTGLKKSQLAVMIASGEFPKPIKLTESGSRKGWLEHEIVEWQQRRVAARDNAA